ncbi:MAG: tRNA 2-thiouridine(34) synthase MnmA [Patescibacteria group bacterium]
MESQKQRVLLGMSGGVDSSVAAVLLLEAGYEVVGAFMKNWSNGTDSTECDWHEERRDALRVAAELGIELHTFDFEKEYRAEVFEYMIAEYQAGRTPNPDVLCNKYMKFGYLLGEAKKLNCEFIATGHYARLVRDAGGNAHLLAGVDPTKDQSYFLCQLTQDQLAHCLFPVGDLLKSRVREIAREHNLAVAEKKDSQGICFIGKVSLTDFLKTRIPPQVGNIVTPTGEIVGTHQGFAYYTIGQREGLGVGGGEPMFVVEIRPSTNEIVVAREGDAALFASSASAINLSETNVGALRIGEPLLARLRYRQPLIACTIESLEPEVVIRFDEAQRAVAPGQFIAFYDLKGEELLGSAVIDKALHNKVA